MVARDGDGWIECVCASKHWGRHGAAGLLLFRDDTVLLQHRAPWVHSGDTWGIPGGARDSHEDALQAATREAIEEIGIDPIHFTPLESFIDNHTVWSYTTIIGRATSDLIAHELNEESERVDWIAFDEVTNLNLHPSFAASWPRLLPILRELSI